MQTITDALKTFFTETPVHGVAAYVRLSPAAVSVGQVTYGAVSRVPRGSIKKLSGRAASRLTRYLQECEAEYRYFGTFTLGADWPRDGRVFKLRLDRFLAVFMRLQRSYCDADRVAYQSCLWFLEFQLRGAPHIHMFYTQRVPWREAAGAWTGAMGDITIFYTCSKLERFAGGRSAQVSYARKYAAKGAGMTVDLAAEMLGLNAGLEAKRKGEITDSELYELVKSEAGCQEAKKLQKVIPPDFEGVGRFWGVRGLKRTVAATTAISAEEGGDDVLGRIAAAIRETKADMARDPDGYIKSMRWTEGKGLIIWGSGKWYSKLVGRLALIVAKHRVEWDLDSNEGIPRVFDQAALIIEGEDVDAREMLLQAKPNKDKALYA